MPQAVAPEFWQAIKQFNQGQFYDCHDTLEALWMEASEPPKNLYQGILQIAVACYHLSNRNWRGAVILLGEGISRLRRYQPAYMGVDIDQLVVQSAQLLEDLQQAGPDNVGDFAQLLQVNSAIHDPSNTLQAAEGHFDKLDSSASTCGLPICVHVLPHETS